MKPDGDDCRAGAEGEPEHQFFLAGVEARPAGACFDLMNPPPCFSHSISTLLGILSLIHMTTSSRVMSPIVNAKLVVKLCAYLAVSEKLPNASGPMTGMSKILPNGMLSPVRPRTTERDSRQPVREAFKRAEAAHQPSGRGVRPKFGSDP